MRLRGSLLAVTVLVAGCGQHTITSNVRPPQQQAQVVSSGTVVAIHNGILLPRHLTVIVGHPIHWQNFDQTGRQLEAVSGATFHSGVFANGAAFSWTPEHVGTVHYRDALHPHTAGTIAVIQ